MNLINFISNNWDSIAALGGLAATVLHLREKGIKLDDLWETILKLGRQAFTKLLHDEAHLYDDAYVLKVITETIWAGLGRLDVKRTPKIEKWVADAAEHVKGELAELVMKHHLDKLQAPLQRTLRKLETASQPEPVL